MKQPQSNPQVTPKSLQVLLQTLTCRATESDRHTQQTGNGAVETVSSAQAAPKLEATTRLRPTPSRERFPGLARISA